MKKLTCVMLTILMVASLFAGCGSKADDGVINIAIIQQLDHSSLDEIRAAIESAIRKKDDDLVGSMASQGTTPRRLTDLIGSLCDLTSGSGDKGTPVVLVQGYFDNLAD